MAGLVCVLDANVLVPPGVRDLLLSLAAAGLRRPVWQVEIEAEVERNVTLVRQRAGATTDDARRYATRALAVMNRAFPDPVRGGSAESRGEGGTAGSASAAVRPKCRRYGWSARPVHVSIRKERSRRHRFTNVRS